MLEFDSPKELSSIIKVIGVGGGGSNAVNFMYKQGVQGVDFVVCNTDEQALNISPVPTRIQLGSEGLGAGCIPEVGRDAALEDISKVEDILRNRTKMVFITAGMGGGTGTGGAPVIAQKAKDMGLLTVGIVTIPFGFEGRKKMQLAEEGIKELRQHVDTLLIICNDKLRELFGNLSITEAFAKADSVVTTGARGIAEVITSVGGINVDFNDVKTVMKDSGVAIMGSGFAQGENRAIKAIEQAMSSPLLNDSNIKGAQRILLYIRSGSVEITMDEIAEITDFIQDEAGSSADVIWGTGNDETLGENIGITFIATGFSASEDLGYNPQYTEKKEKVVHNLFKQEEVVVAPVAVASEPAEVSNEMPEDVITKTTYTLEVEDDFSDESEEEEVDVMDMPTMQEEILEVPEQPVTYTFSEPEVTAEIQQEPKMVAPIMTQTKEVDDPNLMFTVRKKEPENTVREQTSPGQTAVEQHMETKNMDRIRRLKELSTRIKTQNLLELEDQPAYVRRDVKLNEVPSSSEQIVSRFTLSEDTDGQKKVELKQNNSFLHDNVD